MAKDDGVEAPRLKRRRKPEGMDARALAEIAASDTGCKICDDRYIRFVCVDHIAQGGSIATLLDKLRTVHKFPIRDDVVHKHINEHERTVAWWGSLKHEFSDDQARKAFEQKFLSRLSIVLEMWESYSNLKTVFNMVMDVTNVSAVMADGKKRPPWMGATTDNVKKLTKLHGEMRHALEALLALQREKDLVVEVSRVVLLTVGNEIVGKLAHVLDDLDDARKHEIAGIIREAMRTGLEYAKDIGHERADGMMRKARSEYEALARTKGIGG